MVRVGIIGATGYAGAELFRILLDHPEVEITVLTSRKYKNVPFNRVFPAMAGYTELVCEEYEPERISEKADIFFTALPHKIPMEIIPKLVDAGKRVIDLSADFRFQDVERYEACYQPHTAKKYLPESVYGLCEVYTEKIASAKIIGNPGCYPTSTLLPLVPLVKAGLVDTNTIIVDSKSGVSGAGRGVSLATHYCEVNESFKPYKVGEHRHTPEMEEILSREAGTDVTITFVPHLVPMTRGMQTTIYAGLSGKTSPETVRNCLQAEYSGRHFVRIRPDGMPPDVLHVAGTNHCDIGFRIDERNGRIILMSAIDNLVKGAAGQAVQNMNIMLGLDEKVGLSRIPFPI